MPSWKKVVLHGSSGSLAHLKLENLTSQNVLGTDASGNVVAGSVSGYSLPTATGSVLGGIKVGGTLTISAGVLNAKTYVGASAAAFGEEEGGGAAGVAGYVPAASSSQYLSFLRGDGTWQTPTNTVTRLRQSGGTLVAGDFTFAGSGATTVSFAAGVFTISSTDTDTNTTYSAGTGLTLTGTTFSVTTNTFAAAAHSHAIRDITDLQTALDGKQVAGSYAASSHTHDDRYLKLTDTGSFFDRIIDSAPGTLDTLNELAAAIGDDANFSASLARVIAGKADSGHTHSDATTSAAGFMSAADKTKLDGVASNANNYSLPTATDSVLGGIKVGTNLSISSGVLSATDTNTVTSVGVSGDLSTGNIELRGSGATSITKSGGTISISSTDTNTTYTAGTGLTLSGTTFSVTANTYAAAAHNHDDRYYTETEADARFVLNDFGAQTAANAEDEKSGSWPESANDASWGNYKPGDDSVAGYTYNDAPGYVQYNIPTGYTTAYIGQLRWDSGGYFDVHAVMSDGSLVFRGRYLSKNTIENTSHSGNHDGQQIIKISGLDGMRSLRITNQSGRLHLQGIGWTKEVDTANTQVSETHWDLIYDKPSSFTPSSHTHAISNITGLQSALDGKQAAGSYLTSLPSHNHDDRYYTETESDARYLSLSGGNISGRVEFQYNSDRYSQAWKNTTTGAYWWVTTDSGNLGLHRNGDGDKFYFSNGGDFYSTTNGWLSTALSNRISVSDISRTEVGQLRTTLGTTGLPYSCDIVVQGDANTFYPVHFMYGDQDVMRRIIIKRGYGEQAPWDPIGTGAHHGGLLLDWEGNFGGWGGAEYYDRLRVFNQSYTDVCADIFIWSHSMGYVFMLRGGGAIYHIFSDQAIKGHHQEGTPDIAYDTNFLFYDESWSGDNRYDVRAPAPLALNQVNSARIDGLRTKKQSQFDSRYAAISHTHDDRYYTESEVDTKLATKAASSHTHAISDVTNLQTALDGKLGTSGTAASATTAANLGSNYTADDWFRATGDDNQVKLYGNSRSMIFRTDGSTNEHGGGNYAYLWYYGGSSDNSRRMILNTNGDLWTNSYGWLHDYFQVKGSYAASSHTHDDRYYTETEINSLLGGKVSTDNFKVLGAGISYDNDRRLKVDSGLAIYGAYSGGANSPFTYDIAAQFAFGSRAFELSADWINADGANLKLRTLRDCCNNWSPWVDVITSYNIGSQSVNYAASAGGVAWDNVSSKPSSFTPSSHNHDDRYFTETESDARFLKLSGGTLTGQLVASGVSSGVSLHVGNGSTHGVYTDGNERNQLVVSADYYPHMALVAVGANNNTHGAVFSLVGSEGGSARQWNIGIANRDPFLFSIGYNATGDNNPHYGVGDAWSGNDAHHARLSIDRGGNTKIRGMLYVNGTSGGITTGNAVIHAGNIGSQSVNYATSAGNADTVDSLHASSFVRNDTTSQYLKPYYEYGSYLTTERPIDLRNQMGGGGLRVDFMHPSYTGNGNWGHTITWSGYDAYTTYQLAGSYGAGAAVELYVRNERNHERTSWSDWRRLLHDGNFSSYAINRGGDTVTNIIYFQTNNGGKSGATDSARLQAYSTGNNSAFMSFHKGGHYAVNMGLDDDNVLRVGGWSAAANRMQLDMSGNVTFAGNVTGYSDARIKTDVKTIDNALDKIRNLRGVSFRRTDSDDRSTNIGVIAQEILEVLPEVVSQDASGMYNVAYGNMAGLFIEAIKQQQALIEQQQKQIDELKALVDGLTK
jgi:hypothetical protein